MSSGASVIVPPSANWYGSSLSALHGDEFAYCAQNAIVLLHIGPKDSHKIDILSGYSSRTTCVEFVEKEGSVFIVSASQDRCIQVWKRQISEDEYCRHRILSKRPAEIRSISSDCDGTVVLGDKNGNLFLWSVAETGSKIKRMVGCKLDNEIVSIACCPSRRYKFIAVGCKNGSVYFVDYQQQEELIPCTTLRQEVHSLSWCQHGRSEKDKEEFFVAMSSKSGMISVEKVSISSAEESGRGKIECKTIAHFRNSDGTGGKPRVGQDQSSSRFWAGLEWVTCVPSSSETNARGHANFLLSSSYGGKILVWDVGSMMQEDNQDLRPYLKLPENHTRAVFSVKCVHLGSHLYVTSVGLDRICSVWTIPMSTIPGSDFEWKGAKLCHKYMGLGSHPVSISLSYSDSNLESQVFAAIGCGDGTIRIISCTCSGKKSKDMMDTLLWKEIPSPVTVVSWYPSSHSILSFGCQDGTVGVVNLSSRKIHMGTSRHKMSVGALSWIPAKKNKTFNLQSWCPSGVVLSWPDTESIIENNATSGPRDIEPVVSLQLETGKNLMCMSVPFAERSGTIVLGYSSGLLEVCECEYEKPHNVLWSCCLENEDSHILMVTSTSDEQIIVLCDSGDLLMFKQSDSASVCTARGSLPESLANAVPTSMNAYASQGAEVVFYIVVVGFDNGMLVVFFHESDRSDRVAHICKIDELKGHSAPVLQCQWVHNKAEGYVSLFTSSQDQSVRVWNLNLNQYSSMAHVTVDKSTGDVEEGHGKDIQIKPKGKHKDGSTILHNLLPAVTSFPEKEIPMIHDKLDLFLSGAGEQCLQSLENSKESIFGSEYIDVPISGMTSELFIQTCANNMNKSATVFKSDQLSHRRALAHRAAALKLWEGDIGGALRIVMEHDALTADFVCFAAGAGKDAWIATVRVFADQLEKKGDIHLAALYLTQIGDVVDACTLYEKHKMLREAATLASCRLPSNHHVYTRCIESYAKQLARTGHAVKGSLVLSGLGQFEQARAMLNSDLPQN